MSKIRIGLIGAGQRGKDIYGQYILDHPENIEIVAVADQMILKEKKLQKVII